MKKKKIFNVEFTAELLYSELSMFVTLHYVFVILKIYFLKLLFII